MDPVGQGEGMPSTLPEAASAEKPRPLRRNKSYGISRDTTNEI